MQAVMPTGVTFKSVDNDSDGEPDDESTATFSLGQSIGSGSYLFPYFLSVGEFKITSVDTQKKTMSGTFSFTTDDYDYDNPADNANATTVHVTEGTFTNIPYTVYDL